MSLAYWRNALRHEVIAPLLNTHPKYLHHFKNTLAHLNSTQYFVEEQLIALKKTIFLYKEDHISINIKSLKALPSLNFCLHQWFSPLGFHFKEVLKLLEAQTGSSIKSATHCLTHNRSTLLLDTLTLEDPLDDIFYWDLKKPLKNHLKKIFKCEVKQLKSTSSLLGVTNGYKQSSKLGDDRWVSIVASYITYKSPLIIVDCGTAVSIDIINLSLIHISEPTRPY